MHTQLAGVVTQPDRPAGRGHKLKPTPVKTAAAELGVRTYAPASLKTFVDEMRGEAFDLFVLASYGRILPQTLLNVPKLGALNVHPSLLPAYRGATPIQSALLNGDAETGVSIMLMDAGMDTGAIVLQERTPIDPRERYGELHDRLAKFGAAVLKHALDIAASGYIPSTPQHGAASVTKPLRKDDLNIDWAWPAARIVNTVRAFSPAPGARGIIMGEPVKVLRARRADRVAFAGDPGTIAGAHGDALGVRCGDGIVDVLEVIRPNRRAMPGAALVR